VASSRYLVTDPIEFYEEFPHLHGGNHRPTSDATPQPGRVTRPYYIYNCFAFVVGDRRKFWWPGGYGYWPRENAPETVEELMSVLREQFNYEECDGSYEKGVQKVAIFTKNDVPVHIAIQRSSRGGKWLSKMGYNIDMEHDLHAVETQHGDDIGKHGYGTVAKFMRRINRKNKA